MPILSFSDWKTRLSGEGMALPVRPSNSAITKAGIGGFLAIATVALIGYFGGNPLVLGSFGASCVLVFGYPDSPFSQPRNVFFGHVISSAIGLLCLTLLGPAWWAMALAVALAIMAMMALRIVHPPAGSNPVIVFLSMPGWGFLVFPTLCGALLICVVALVYNNLSRTSPYPKYW
ncbi:HPP family protein [Undibacterium oligocarboniphilum]|uniref:HPP family protein n=2 Tax=Undibacterium oligocarboniphilum TaxID=666702 RepID=A0A850QHS3_9BURK|nr:HPP family protein [Undibacterium oligocarboniphilum]NVO76320.1 HPP family protein [Undibacterium oligocarboniphilum]